MHDEIMTPEKRNPSLYNYVALKKPKIRKLGTIKCDMVETTPIVFNGKLYRFEYFRASLQNEANPVNMSHFHFVDVRTNKTTPPFAFNHHLGAAYTDGEYMYAFGTVSNNSNTDSTNSDWGHRTIKIYRSKDLETWEDFSEIVLPENMKAYNLGVCKLNGIYTMLIEEVDISIPLFRFRFAQSTDMKNWTLLDEDYRFHETPRYTGAPAIYTLPDDPHYYVFYLEEYPGPSWATCIARSKDLKKWTYSPINPVLMYDDEDKKIANHFLTPHERARIDRAMNVNNSDLELCEFLGRTIIYYSWGAQRGIEFLSEAVYEGPMKELLQGFFEKE